jgi:hypothetical protein
VSRVENNDKQSTRASLARDELKQFLVNLIIFGSMVFFIYLVIDAVRPLLS